MAGRHFVRRKGFIVRVSKLQKFLSVLSLIALCAVGALAQAQPEGQEPGALPVLVMHLPEWEKKVNGGYVYARSMPELLKAAEIGRAHV